MISDSDNTITTLSLRDDMIRVKRVQSRYGWPLTRCYYLNSCFWPFFLTRSNSFVSPHLLLRTFCAKRHVYVLVQVMCLMNVFLQTYISRLSQNNTDNEIFCKIIKKIFTIKFKIGNYEKFLLCARKSFVNWEFAIANT